MTKWHTKDYWPFVEDLLALSLTFTQTLVPCSSSCSLKHLKREVFCDYPVVEGMGYQEVEGVCVGVAVLNCEYQSTHNQENQSYIGTSIGFGLTYQSEIRKVQGYHYLCTLGRGSNSLLPLGLPPKLKAEETATALLIYRLDRGVLTSWV